MPRYIEQPPTNRSFLNARGVAIRARRDERTKLGRDTRQGGVNCFRAFFKLLSLFLSSLTISFSLSFSLSLARHVCTSFIGYPTGHRNNGSRILIPLTNEIKANACPDKKKICLINEFETKPG